MIIEIPDRSLNELIVETMSRTVDRAKHAHMTDVRLRVNGAYEFEEADWIKHMRIVTPYARSGG